VWVGIANSGIKARTSEQVTFATKQGRTTTIHPVEFLCRLTQHVLRPGFHKIRHPGLYGSVQPGGLLERAKVLVGAYRRPKRVQADLERLGRAVCFCPICGGERWRTALHATSRAPPALPL
jgi:hypothetical protein